MKFIQAALKHRQVTLSVLFICFVAGVYSLFTMPRREDPKITMRIGLVLAYYPGANSIEVEEHLTKKVEKYLFQYDEVLKAKTVSTSRDGFMSIAVELKENVVDPDVFWSKLRHQLLINKQLELPEGVLGPIVNSDFGDTEAMVIALSSNEMSADELLKSAHKLEDRLRTVSELSKVKITGETKLQYTICLDQLVLSQSGLSVEDIVKVLKSQNTLTTSGKINQQGINVELTSIGVYKNGSDIGEQIVGASKSGELIRLKDVASIEREKADPSSFISVNGANSLLLALQMEEGKNIVTFGKKVNQILKDFDESTTASLQIQTIVDQPSLVDHNVSHFIKEFFVAIIAVVAVVMLLLPLRVAAVAATAIPVTVALTFALMNFFGIDLNQVSLAALIVVLGMVVDDAIVIADNYVEQLDEGKTPWEAAWRSASELFVPVLAATITIIASFLPMALLKGSIGEFISALPWTVAISLASSFVVAILLTPFLCFTFIKKGLHSDLTAKKSLKNKLLDGMQDGYNKLLDVFVKYPKATIAISFSSIIIAGLLYFGFVKQRFFPFAERGQFVVDVWLPTGTALDKTQAAILQVDEVLKTDSRVEQRAVFVGTSAPRFYYNFSPELPTTNFGQVLINTKTEKNAIDLSKELKDKFASNLVGARVHVRLMQQGQPLAAPIEVRVSGEDIDKIKSIAQEVEMIIKNEAGHFSVRPDFKEDYFRGDVVLKDEAKRLGFTTESISKFLYLNHTGASITTVHESDEVLNVVLKLKENTDSTVSSVLSTYIMSPVTKQFVPLYQIADLVPNWYPGRIMHHNGVRTLTVQSETTDDVLPSQLLAKIKPKIEELKLPAGYEISYGGEFGNQKETMGSMIGVLLISLVLIFLILLFQFKNLKETFIVMLTIPLSLLGAITGLVITGNNFGFTAFVGLISLSGIVVRNAIILVDHTRELRFHHGMGIYEAAIESGKRRLRPIFLTAMAAAIGVLPMILSGSPMWSPLASVIAFGVVWSMVTALFTVPILYIKLIK